MSGTDHSQKEDWAGPQPVMVLVNPQMGENIGASARAMWNFGLDRMRLVNPRDSWPNPAAQATASGAAQVLDHLSVHADLADAVADRTYVYATTARGRDLTKEVFTPQEAMKDAKARIDAGEKVAVLFGAERAGLENSHIAQANALISIPVNPAFASLNLGQAVLLTAYEWRLNSEASQETIKMAQAEPADQNDIHALTQRLEDELDQRGFFFPEDKAASMKLSLRNLFSRLSLTKPDIRTFHGIIRAFTRDK